MSGKREFDKRNSKGSRPDYRSKGKSRPKREPKMDEREERVTSETSAVGNNNPEWYIPNRDVMEQACRFSFDNFIGVPVSLDPSGGISGLTAPTLRPGAVMQIFLNPSPGYTSVDDPKVAAVNQQAFRTYARLSSINSKNTQYTPNDITTMILSMGELISLIGLAQRAYGLLWTYNVRNRTMPATLVDIAGVDSTKLRAAAAPYLIRLNTLLVEANKIPFPSNIDYFKRCMQIYSSVYKDSPSDMGELYVAIPYSTWDMDETYAEGTALKEHVLYGTSISSYAGMDPTDLLDLIENKINDMLTSATYNYVYSDIVNLSTKDPSVSLMEFQPVDFAYTCVPVYDQEFLLKINNASIMGVPAITADQLNPTGHTNANDVYPDVDTLCMIYAPQWVRTIPDLGLLRPLNFSSDNPTLEERIIAARYACGSNLTLSSGKYYTGNRVAMNDHYIVKICVYAVDVTTKDFSLAQNAILNSSSEGSILTRFSQHPYIFNMGGTAGAYTITGVIGDLDFWTLIDFETLRSIDRLSLFALFDNKDVTKVYQDAR